MFSSANGKWPSNFFSKFLPTHRAKCQKECVLFSGVFQLTCFTQCKWRKKNRRAKKKTETKNKLKRLNRNEIETLESDEMFSAFSSFSFFFRCAVFVCLISEQPSSQWNIIHVTLSLSDDHDLFLYHLAPLEHWTWILSILELAKVNFAATNWNVRL